MTLDSWLVARLAQELDALLRGARIQFVQASEGGLILFCYRRGMQLALHASVDSNAPLLGAYENAGSQKENGSAGWASPVAALLRGCIVDAIHAVPKDRVVYVDVSSSSAFGVPSLSRLVIELQPRKANALILRAASDDSWTVVAAVKQFDGAGDARSVHVGARYEPPPLRHPRVDRAQFIVLAGNIDRDDAAGLARLLGAFDPQCTPPLANEVIARVAAAPNAKGHAHALLETWAVLRREVAHALEASKEVYVFRSGGAVSVCHLVPLTWPAGEAITAQTVNEICATALQARPAQRGAPSLDALRKKLATMLLRCEEETTALARAQLAGQQADSLRQSGNAIYSNLTEIVPGGSEFATAEGLRIALDPHLSAKENAAEYFRKYKKARSGLPRVRARLQTLRSNREYWEHLLWELERVGSAPPSQREAVHMEIAEALGIKLQRRPARRSKAESKAELSGGAIAYVGRSPKENERLTFSVAGGNDYWFHARGVPGAHVIVKTSGTQITPRQIEEAAALAAGQSRAAGANSVEVDYTQRKHVRRHSSGRPGLVWYTDFATVRVAPRARNVS